eukprot:CAMPEP_0204171792 /NCGR_PEP_ID=MMETSP0361-20130328/43557_1 /ASSEMBLY_ACC=CAM_ASM_000343 /TAXON_ID=268821 /ORGANISM="Scrippsiella Hangoei, Strain SHTV-5" /LENGTH=268 /DNA_ID=CAMNT_0051129777 /DNA_START=30 /DNA_END=833 /DNA_ORIENTATION=-
MDEELCPLWAPDGSPEVLDGAWFGIYDADAPLVEIELHESMPPVAIAQGLGQTKFGTARFVWNSAVRLSRCLAGLMLRQASSDPPGTSAAPLLAFELGSGTGVCAAALALALRSVARPCEVLATDLPQSLPLLVNTARRNRLEGVLRPAVLDWNEALAAARACSETAFDRHDFDIGASGAEASWPQLASADLIFGADITFSAPLRRLVLELLVRACSAGAVAILAHEDRDDQVDLRSALEVALAGEDIRWAELDELEGGGGGAQDVLI